MLRKFLLHESCLLTTEMFAMRECAAFRPEEDARTRMHAAHTEELYDDIRSGHWFNGQESSEL